MATRTHLRIRRGMWQEGAEADLIELVDPSTEELVAAHQDSAANSAPEAIDAYVETRTLFLDGEPCVPKR